MKIFMTVMLIFLAMNLLISDPAVSEKEDEGVGELYHNITSEQYEIVRALEDDPLDPEKDDLEYLLLLRGFTSYLIDRISLSAKSYGSEWMSYLSPSDRRMVARYALYIKIPDRRRGSSMIKLSAKDLRKGSSPWRDSSLRIARGPLDLAAVARIRERKKEMTAAASIRLPFGTNLFGGDFIPDYAMGIISVKSTMNYPFSHGYPLRKCRWITNATRFYGDALRGGAVGFMRPGYRAMVFTGKRRRYYDYKFRTGRGYYSGGRFELKIRGSSVGINCLDERALGRGVLFGIDATTDRGSIARSFESSISSHGGYAFSCAFRVRGKGASIGAAFLTTGDGYTSLMGRNPIDGNKLRGIQRGAAISLQKMFHTKAWVRLAIHKSAKWYDYGEHEKTSIRFQIERKSGESSYRLGWKRNVRVDRPLAPYPTPDAVRSSLANTVKILVSVPLFKCLKLRSTAEIPWSDGISGYLHSHALRISGPKALCRLDTAVVLHKALRGAPSFYCYVPVLDGIYPWSYFSGTGLELFSKLELSRGAVSVSVVLNVVSGRQSRLFFQSVIRM